MYRVILLIKMLLVSLCFVFLGTMVLVIPLDASPIWPLDGSLAILGGVGLGCLTVPFWRETSEEEPQGGTRLDMTGSVGAFENEQNDRPLNRL